MSLLRAAWGAISGDVESRRRHVRVVPPANEPVRIQIMGRGFLESLHAKDISRGGLAVFVPHGLELEEDARTVKLVITIPRARPFTVSGLVRHISATPKWRVYGIEFVELSDEGGHAIDELVDHCQRNSGTVAR